MNQLASSEKTIQQQEKQLNEKDSKILGLQKEIERLKCKLNMDGTNSNISTSKTPIDKKKVILDTREKSDKPKGGQLGHKKHKLEKFQDDEVTEYLGHVMCNCPHCNSNEIKSNGKIIEKDESECNRHLISDLKKTSDNLNHKWCKQLIELLTKMNHKRNNLIHKEIEEFSRDELDKFKDKFSKIMLLTYEENEKDKNRYYADTEKTLIKRILDYQENYFLWLYNFEVPFTNNLSERKIRGAKSKQKASGQFLNEKTAQNHASIRSYIETCHRNSVNVYNALLMLNIWQPYALEDILSGKIN